MHMLARGPGSKYDIEIEAPLKRIRRGDTEKQTNSTTFSLKRKHSEAPSAEINEKIQRTFEVQEDSDDEEKGEEIVNDTSKSLQEDEQNEDAPEENEESHEEENAHEEKNVEETEGKEEIETLKPNINENVDDDNEDREIETNGKEQIEREEIPVEQCAA
uniref:Uncharacterized protein n=2 Tax=Caenorhabditis japonica TaxID=281687 RepID=A0A8R1IFU9_CAEJA